MPVKFAPEPLYDVAVTTPATLSPPSKLNTPENVAATPAIFLTPLAVYQTESTLVASS